MEDLQVGTPLAQELYRVVQPKLQECGWTTGGDDTTLFDYILLMLANDKNESQVASELSNDLLDLGPENPETQTFARWLFEQIDLLRRQLGGGGGGNQGGDTQIASTANNQTADAPNDGPATTQDTEMEGATEPPAGSSSMYADTLSSPISSIFGGTSRALTDCRSNQSTHSTESAHRLFTMDPIL